MQILFYFVAAISQHRQLRWRAVQHYRANRQGKKITKQIFYQKVKKLRQLKELTQNSIAFLYYLHSGKRIFKFQNPT